jgi:hypothetical protein
MQSWQSQQRNGAFDFALLLSAHNMVRQAGYGQGAIDAIPGMLKT